MSDRQPNKKINVDPTQPSVNSFFRAAFDSNLNTQMVNLQQESTYF